MIQNGRIKSLTTKKSFSTVNEDGTIKPLLVVEQDVSFYNDEPIYVKIYSEKWAELNTYDITDSTINLFISIANRMEYANKKVMRECQCILIDADMRQSIMQERKMTNEKVFFRHLKLLVDCGAIRPALDCNGKKKRSCYQVNPSFASKGHWRTSVNYPGFGVRDLVKHWDDKDFHTIVWTPKNKGVENND